MAEPIATYPVLSTAVNYLTARSEIGAAIIYYLLMSPGWTSDSHEDQLISFRTIASEFGHDPDRICTVLESRIVNVLSRYFPNDKINAEFKVKEYQDPEKDYNQKDSRYAISFDVSFIKPDGNVEPAVLQGAFEVNVDESINVHFT